MTLVGDDLTSVMRTRDSYLSTRMRLPSLGRRRATEDIVNQAVEELVRREVTTAMKTVLAGTQGDGTNGGGSVFGAGFGTDGRRMEMTLDNMVADILVNGRQTSGVLRALFGLVPVLAGR